MNGPSHYSSSEACLIEADRAVNQAAATGYLLAAQAHALLAIVAAIAGGTVEPAEAWREALS